MSPKRKQGDILYPGHLGRPRRKVTVLDIRDLEGEYLLVLARLQLIKIGADPTRATGLKHKYWSNWFNGLALVRNLCSLNSMFVLFVIVKTKIRE